MFKIAIIFISFISVCSFAPQSTATDITYYYTGNQFNNTDLPQLTGCPAGITCDLSGYISASVTLKVPKNFTGIATGSAISSYSISANDGHGLIFSSSNPLPGQIFASDSYIQLTNGAVDAWFLGSYTRTPQFEEVATNGIYSNVGADHVNYGAGQGASAGYGFVLNKPGTWTISSPPTPLELAEMSNGAYTNIQGPPAPIDGYTPIDTANGFAGFGAEAYRSGNNIVLAIRGTVQTDLVNKLKTEEADYSFSSKQSTDELKYEVDQATSLLIKLQAQCSTCNFYLTGHSLGGAIAQILNSATNLPTLAFNAPGAGALLSQLKSDTSDLNSVEFANSGGTLQINSTSTNNDTNLREYGDLISLNGDTIGNQVTITTPYPTTATNPIEIWQQNHQILTVINSLTAQLPETPGRAGPQLNSFIGALGTGYILQANYRFHLAVIAGVITPLDPPSSQFYRFIENSGSPYLQSVSLPLLPGVSSYELEYLQNGVWSSATDVAAATFFEFGSDVSGFAFSGLDSSGHVVTIPTEFDFETTYASSGTLDATLYTASASVPELKTWGLFIIGFMLIGSLGRRKYGAPVEVTV